MEIRMAETMEAIVTVQQAVKDLNLMEICALFGMTLDYWQVIQRISFEESQEVLEYVRNSREMVFNKNGMIDF